MSLVEIMAWGGPVIGADRGIGRELIARDDADFDPATPADLAAKLDVFLLQSSLRANLGEVCSQRAQLFTPLNPSPESDSDF
jgi:hypothetical protein